VKKYLIISLMLVILGLFASCTPAKGIGQSETPLSQRSNQELISEIDRLIPKVEKEHITTRATAWSVQIQIYQNELILRCLKEEHGNQHY
jgi:hypothetical protein